MNHATQPGDNEHKDEHGTFISYVIGYLLSAALTFVAYYWVDNQTMTGKTLLMAIIGLGLLQMLVQIVFFLHLGRGPKPLYNIAFFVSTVGVILIVVGGSIVIIDNLHKNMLPSDQVKKIIDDEAIYQIGGEKTGACYGQNNNHQVLIVNGQVSPAHTLAQRCDTLSFINEDDVTREFTFGAHPEHKSYAGNADIIVRKGRSKTITLSETGTYKFHDHLRAETAGKLTVNP